jgi:hypothetical protein
VTLFSIWDSGTAELPEDFLGAAMVSKRSLQYATAQQGCVRGWSGLKKGSQERQDNGKALRAIENRAAT